MTDDGDMTGSECLTPKRRDDFERMGETHLQNRMFTDPAFHGQLREAALEWLREKQDAREEAEADHRRTETKRFRIIALLAGAALLVSAIGVLVSLLK